MSKELYIVSHEQLIEEYMEENPDCDWSKAYELTADDAYGRMRENLADIADYARMKAKDRL